MIGLKNSRLQLNQSDSKPNPIATWPHAFSRALDWSHVFSCSQFFIILFAFVVMAHCNCIGDDFDLTNLNCKPLYGSSVNGINRDKLGTRF